jgi:hypothetical protein
MPATRHLYPQPFVNSPQNSRKLIRFVSMIFSDALCLSSDQQDTWHLDKHLFDEDQSQALQMIVSGTSYCMSSISHLYVDA